MQSKIFSDMWINLDQEKEENSNSEPFIWPTISEKCFRRIVEWMRHRNGQPDFELKIGQDIGQQIWFQPDEWECNFGFGIGKNKMDLEAVKELYMAANYLDISSLFHYCIQQFAFAVIHAEKLEQVREILCLVDDLTQEEKAAIYQEFVIPVPKEKKPIYSEKEIEIVGIQNPLPPELVHPIFAKLSLSDQRWLLPLNRDSYKYLADRVRKHWPKWMNMVKIFLNEDSNWAYGFDSAFIPCLYDDQPILQWTLSNFLASRSLQTEILNTQNFVEHQINSINAEPIATEDQIDELRNKRMIKDRLKSILMRAIEYMDAIFHVERISTKIGRNCKII